MIDIKQVADRADMIVNSYAFTREDDRVRVLNLNRTDKAVVMDAMGNVLEASMDDIEIQIVKSYWRKNGELLEDIHA